MRISSSWAQQANAYSLMNQSAKVNKIQMQLSTGNRLTAASDDPVAAAHIAVLNLNLKQTEQYQKNISVGQQRLGQEADVLTSAVEVVNKIKELGIRGLNGITGSAARTGIANEMKTLRDQLLTIANTQDASGGYIFSGFKTGTPPFAEKVPGPGYDYNGDLSQRSLQISTGSTVLDGNPGTDVFGTPTGAAAVPGALTSSAGNIFEAIDRFTADMLLDNPDKRSLTDLQTSLDKISTVQSSVGGRQNALDDQKNINDDNILALKGSLGKEQDLDYADAMTQFNLQSTVLQAAQQSYSKVQGLSLFNYL
ncbi:MAG: flagellar hook-associated protein FlgL [Methylococcaceae bacterium]